MLEKKHKLLKSQKGFTLIELLAVIVILAIIAAIAVPAIGNVIKHSRIDAVKADAIQVLNGAKLYVAGSSLEFGESNTITLKKAQLEPYLDDEAGKLTSYSVTVTNNNNKYTYTITGKGKYGSKGDETVTFKNASLKAISNAGKGDTRITPADAGK
ncbi:prepilin-type N-terminal cleavage/methylation domain-containing protein [Heyndrickxia acidiproducens]|uniref:prepilin-type N-terminal cleavage/methylation domain-containing protein n=1 Tax=Heyndrickxia acidiproducens TaxID=1121084 RepID=UPI00037E31DC|nr:prepilin-type N-terminal cleavage/methylation domain-containing protein [Heyndrickxia acidiproducens]